MDRLKHLADEATNSSNLLEGISFPIDKNDLVSQLEQHGVPSHVLDRVKSVNTDRFTNADELKSLLS